VKSHRALSGVLFILGALKEVKRRIEMSGGCAVAGPALIYTWVKSCQNWLKLLHIQSCTRNEINTG
jgi:hypothetical protein